MVTTKSSITKTNIRTTKVNCIERLAAPVNILWTLNTQVLLDNLLQTKNEYNANTYCTYLQQQSESIYQYRSKNT